MQAYKLRSVDLAGFYVEDAHGRFARHQKHRLYPMRAVYLQWAADNRRFAAKYAAGSEQRVHYARDAKFWLRQSRSAAHAV